MRLSHIFIYLKTYSFALLFFIFIFIFFLHPVGGDGDIYHHLYTGRDVYEQHRIPSTDHYTFTANGRYWIPFAWGMGTIFYLLQLTFGDSGIVVFVSLTAVLLLYLLFKFIKSYGIDTISTISALTIGAAVMGIRWPNRPEIILYPLLISLLILDRMQNHYIKLSLLYPFLFIIWANLYGSSVLLGLAILGLFMLQKLISPTTKRSQPSTLYLGSVIVSFFAVLINPNGLNTIFYSYLIRDISQFQGEWQGLFSILTHLPLSSTIIYQYRILVYFLYFLLCVILGCIFYKQAWKHRVLFIFWLALLSPFFAIRYTTLAVVLSLPLLAILIQQSFRKWKTVTGVVIISITLITTSTIWWTNLHGIGADEELFTKKLISFFKQYDLSGDVFADQQLGSFLSYYLYPTIKVFYDTRDDLFSNTAIPNDYRNIIVAQKDIDSLIAKYKPDIIVAQVQFSTSYKTLFYSRQWDLAYFDGNIAVFVPPNVAKLKHMPVYTALDPYDSTGAKPNMATHGVNEYSSLLREQPESFALRSLLGSSLFAINDFDRAIMIANTMKTDYGPSTPFFSIPKYRLLVESDLSLNKCREAKNNLDRYNVSISNKLLFNWGRRIPSSFAQDSIMYYIGCEYNTDALLQSYKDLLSDNTYTDADLIQIKRLIYQKYGYIPLPIL